MTVGTLTFFRLSAVGCRLSAVCDHATRQFNLPHLTTQYSAVQYKDSFNQ